MTKAVSYSATDESKSESDRSTTESASMEFNKNPENTINPRINFMVACWGETGIKLNRKKLQHYDDDRPETVHETMSETN